MSLFSKDGQLPLDIIWHIAQQLTFDDESISPQAIEDYLEGDRSDYVTLRSLSQTSKRVRAIVEPLMFRCLFADHTAGIVLTFLRLAQNPQLRQSVRHLIWWAPMTGDRECKIARKVWAGSCGPDTTAQEILDKAGFSLDYEAVTEGQLALISPDFEEEAMISFILGCILVMVPAAERITFNSVAPTDLKLDYGVHLLDNVIQEAVESKGYPVLPMVTSLCMMKDGVVAIRSYILLLKLRAPGMWSNLQSLILWGMQFEGGFLHMIMGGAFGAELNIQKLIIRCEDNGLGRTDERVVDQAHGTSFEQAVDFVEVFDKSFHAFRAFSHLRVLDVEFPDPPVHPHRVMGLIRESPVLRCFIKAVGAPEVLRLIRHSWPAVVLGDGEERHDRLKELIMEKDEQNPDFIPYDGKGDLREFVNFRYGVLPDAPALEMVKINECTIDFKAGRQYGCALEPGMS
ncbi:Fc.00g047900.m01.CDS01 [Cosmosporella sp. VM-42]